MIEKIKALIAQGEGLKVEFKEATSTIPNTVYETVCSFLNTKGGDILLGVADNGVITGVNSKSVFEMQQMFSSGVNNNQFINPPFCLQLDQYTIEDKIILHVFIPESSQVHRYKKSIYIRKHDTDLNVTNNQEEVRRLYNQKSSSYSENRIFKAVTMEDLREDLFEEVRKIVTIKNANHSWTSMDNLTMLRNIGLYQKDLNTGDEGFTLACILLFGKDEIIHRAVPAFKIDLIKRVENKDRYDDRDVFTTNLLESYKRAMSFVEKHLPSPFYLEKDMRIDLRNILFREIIANAIVHKEYLGAEPTKFIIEEDKIYTENSNKPYINGLITMSNTTSHPKNPTIAKFFRELGLVEELGSGVNKLFHYSKIYTGHDPIIEDLPIFKFSLQIPFFKKKVPVDLFDKTSSDQVISATSQKIKDPRNDQPSDQPGDQLSDQVSDQVNIILDFCTEPKSLQDIMAEMHIVSRMYFMNKILKPLIDKGLVARTYPDKPNHPNQKYVTIKRD